MLEIAYPYGFFTNFNFSFIGSVRAISPPFPTKTIAGFLPIYGRCVMQWTNILVMGIGPSSHRHPSCTKHSSCLMTKTVTGVHYSATPKAGWVIPPSLLLWATPMAPVKSSPYLCLWCGASTIQFLRVGASHGLPSPNLRASKSAVVPNAEYQKWSHQVAMGFARESYYHQCPLGPWT